MTLNLAGQDRYNDCLDLVIGLQNSTNSLHREKAMLTNMHHTQMQIQALSHKKDFKKVSEFVIVDCAAGLGNEAFSALKLADEVIIVSNPEIAAITDALKAVKLAEELNKRVLGVIMTKIKKDNIEMGPSTVKDMLEIPVLGMIPEEDTVRESLNLKDAVVHTHPKSKAARAYKEIAAQLCDAEYDSDKDRERLLIRLLQKLGLRK